MTAIDILPPEANSNRGRAIHRAAGSAVDATFVTIRRTASRRPGTAKSSSGGLGNQKPPAAHHDPLASALQTGIEKAERALMRLSADFFAAVVAVLCIVVFVLCGGFSLLGGSPEVLGKPGLDLTHVNLTPQDADGMRVLMINGIVENKGDDRLQFPGIQANLVADGSVVASILIDPPVPEIQSGHSHGFSARIPHPGGKIPELKLSFAPQGASSL